MNSNDNILLAREYNSDTNKLKRQHASLSYITNSGSNEDGSLSGEGPIAKQSNNSSYYDHLASKISNDVCDDAGNSLFNERDNNTDGQAGPNNLNETAATFYDINSIPASLSVSISRSSDCDDNDDDIGIEVKKTIMVGSDYQASIPEYIGPRDLASGLPYAESDKLLWSPYSLSDQLIEEYLVKSHQIYFTKATGVAAISRGTHTRDDEQALYVLLQSDYDVDAALEKLNSENAFENNPPPPPLWTEEECRNFESGIRLFGKDFYLIHMHKVKSRSVGDLVQFYYLWKKTERYDSFVNIAKLEKRRNSISSSGTTSSSSDHRENFSPPSKDYPFSTCPGTTDFQQNCIYDSAQETSNSSGSAADPMVIENLFMQKIDKKNHVFDEVTGIFDIYDEHIAEQQQAYPNGTTTI